MVARTAFTQLGYSSRMLALTVIGMLLTYVAPVFAAVVGAMGAASGWNGAAALLAASTGVAAWLLMAVSFVPTLRWYRVPIVMAALLPLAGLLYTCMTVDSAVRRWRGSGANWKGRTYA